MCGQAVTHFTWYIIRSLQYHSTRWECPAPPHTLGRSYSKLCASSAYICPATLLTTSCSRVCSWVYGQTIRRRALLTTTVCIQPPQDGATGKYDGVFCSGTFTHIAGLGVTGTNPQQIGGGGGLGVTDIQVFGVTGEAVEEGAEVCANFGCRVAIRDDHALPLKVHEAVLDYCIC